jgi:hypothetical protein
MKLVETIALRRSGHHAVMSWFIKNNIGMSDWSYKLTVQNNTKTLLWNDAGNNNDYEIKLFKNLGSKPQKIFINYEDVKYDFTKFSFNNIYNGPDSLNLFNDIVFNESKRVLVIRDFYNNLCSRITHNKNNGHYVMDCGQNFIELWKNHAKSIIDDKVFYIKYEDWLTNIEVRRNFLKDVFGIKEIYNENDAKGFFSSYHKKNDDNLQTNVKFDKKDYLNRFNPNLIPEETKELIRKDNELHYLIGTLGYEYKEI